MTQINYDYLINQIQRDLPTLPTIVNELTNILENPNTSTMAVEDVVRGDQTMAAKILRVANTTFYRGAGSKSEMSTLPLVPLVLIRLKMRA